jgi:hypothetical protein
MTTSIRLSSSLFKQMTEDLSRPHVHAWERVAFLFATLVQRRPEHLLLDPTDYVPVEDDRYVVDDTVGAAIDSQAIRGAMQRALNTKECVLHVHTHGGWGVPGFSSIDLRMLHHLAPSFRAVAREAAHGGLVLSRNAAHALIWCPSSKNTNPSRHRIATPLGGALETQMSQSERHSRQTFLGPNSEKRLAEAQIGILGLGGGGSHIVQQFAHAGVGRFVLFDPDVIEESNLNRMVGATRDDVAQGREKFRIAERVILGLQERPLIEAFGLRWQEKAKALAQCSIILGAVDGFQQRSEIEVFARDHAIPYIDIGLDVRCVKDEPPRMAGQVFVSLPGRPCMRCCRVLTAEAMAEEGRRYGDAGPRPQVVWANGVLASTAVGIAIDILTGWTLRPPPLLLTYDGNLQTLAPPRYVRHLDLSAPCPHFPERDASASHWQTL